MSSDFFLPTILKFSQPKVVALTANDIGSRYTRATAFVIVEILMQDHLDFLDIMFNPITEMKQFWDDFSVYLLEKSPTEIEKLLTKLIWINHHEDSSWKANMPSLITSHSDAIIKAHQEYIDSHWSSGGSQTSTQVFVSPCERPTQFKIGDKVQSSDKMEWVIVKGNCGDNSEYLVISSDLVFQNGNVTVGKHTAYFKQNEIKKIESPRFISRIVRSFGQ